MDSITPTRLYEDQREELHLELLGSSLASRRDITVSDVNRPGMALMGFVENFLPERIQILAQTELAYLATLSEPALREAATRIDEARGAVAVLGSPWLSIEDNAALAAKLERRFSDRGYAFLQTQYLRDSFKAIDYFVAPTFGAGYKLIDRYATQLGLPAQTLSGSSSGGEPPYTIVVHVRTPGGVETTYSRSGATWTVSPTAG